MMTRISARAARGRLCQAPCCLLVAVLALVLTACAESAAESPASVDSGNDGASLALAEPAASLSKPSAELRQPTPTDSEAALSGPRVLAPETVHDFGTVYAGALLEHTFVLNVVGTEDLVIEKIKPGCGCTVATPMLIAEDGSSLPYEIAQPLPPGSRLELLCRFDTSGKRGPQAKGINVYCNDPRGVERLTLKVELEEFLNTVPNSLQLGRFSILEERTGEIVMTTRGSGPVKLSLDSRRIPAELKVDFVPRNPDADGRATSWTVVVTLGGDKLTHGPFQYRVPIYSDVENPKAPANNARPDQRWLGGTIWVTAEVLDVYSFSPKQLFFGQVAADSSVSRGFSFNSFDDEYPLTVLEASVVGPEGEPIANEEHYHVSIEPGNAEGTWRVELLVDGLPAGVGLFEGRVRIATKNPDRPHVDVFFKGIVR